MLREQHTALAEGELGAGQTSQAVLGTQDEQSQKELFKESSEESEDESVDDSISASCSLLIRPSPATDRTNRTDYAAVGPKARLLTHLLLMKSWRGFYWTPITFFHHLRHHLQHLTWLVTKALIHFIPAPAHWWRWIRR